MRLFFCSFITIPFFDSESMKKVNKQYAVLVLKKLIIVLIIIYHLPLSLVITMCSLGVLETHQQWVLFWYVYAKVTEKRRYF